MCDRGLNWSPLDLWADPVPGCPERIDTLADELRQMAERLTSEVTVLEGIEQESDDPDVWDSDAAVRFLELQRELRPDLMAVSERYQVAAGALSDYAVELRTAQAESEDALDLARSAQEQLEDSDRGIRQMEMAADSDEEWTGPDHHEQRAEARRLLEQARADLEDAIRRRDQAAEAAASAVAEHIHGDGLQNLDPNDHAAALEMMQRLEEDPSLWANLSDEDRALLIEQFPDRIGNLDGIPIVDRDAANRIYMEQTREDLEARRAELIADNADGRHDAEIEAIDRQLAGIKVIDDRLNEAPDGREAYLVGFEPEPNARAIVAMGNPDTADNVVTYVPGTGTELSGSLKSDLDRADIMADDANRLDENAETAAIMWMGYDAPPDIPDATDPSYAADGAGALRDFQAGLEATHVDGGANYTVLGHSYGSTVIGHAASGGELNADNLVFVGSPGVGVDHVSDLGIDPDRVYATNAFHDPVGYTPGPIHGIPPTRDGFGATEFRSDPGSVGFSAPAHSEYWDAGNQARDSMAAIITGNDHLVNEGRENAGWYDTIEDGVGSVRDGVDTVVDGVKDGVDTVVDGVRDGVDTVVDGVKDGVDAVTDGVSDGIDWARDRLGI